MGGRDNLTINVGHMVIHLETSGDRVTHVLSQDLQGNATRRYRGKFSVLAAGSLESGKIGVGWTDDPALFSVKYIVPDGNPFAGSDHLAKVFLFRPDATLTDHPFNVEALINPGYWHFRNSDTDLRARI